jgi:DeoR/GlpR family transcriptional regulator of sugar metabolism
MFQLERRNVIIEYLEEHESATVEELAKRLDVTPMTIRRDLQYLEDTNVETRTFGGAVLKSRLTTEVPYKDKSISQKKEKDRISEYAAALVQNGQIVLLDAGTTCMEIAKKLKAKNDLTIITTDVMIAAYLSSTSDFKILCTGGYVQNSTGTCIGAKATEFLRDINVDISFIGASSVDIERGMSTPTFEKSEVKLQMIKSTEKSVLVTDSSKFGKRSFSKVCDLNEFDLIITDSNIKNELIEKLKAQEINIKIV